jgi:hypothetical protein
MTNNGIVSDHKCGHCGITEDAHLELYGTSLGFLTFNFRPDQGPILEGEVYLCRPCTHEVLSRRILHAAGIGDKALMAETWK